MKKVFGQTVRDIKREVNKKVLKVPSIERKVLDATSNEPWGPHGTLLADIAQATKNYHELQMIMGVIWKRINDTGKNWRHVYKALLVLEYLVAHGAERAIDEIKEHAYQISTLSDFQYVDSGGRDQGSNVRKKSQSLVALVNDKERIIEVRQKAASNRDKFRNTSAGAGGYGDRYEDGRYGSREEDRNGYSSGRERDYNYRDDDRYGRYGDPNGDRYGRDYDERQSRDGYRDDESRSSDKFDQDGQSSSRGSGARADDQSQDGRPLEQKFSVQNIGAPPNYEEAVSESRSPAHGERNGEITTSTAGGSYSPAPTAASPSTTSSANAESQKFSQETSPFASTVTLAANVDAAIDEFDPRGPTAAAAATTPAASPAPTTFNNVEVDLLGSLLGLDSPAPNPLAMMPVSSATTTSATDIQPNLSGSAFAATQSESSIRNTAIEDPFGESPFKAIPFSESVSAQPQTTATPLQATVNQNMKLPQAAVSQVANPFGDAFSGMTYSAGQDFHPPSTNSQFLTQELSTSQEEEIDILADILPPSVPSLTTASQTGSLAPTEQPVSGTNGNIDSQAGSMTPVAPTMAPPHVPQVTQFTGGNLLPQGGIAAPITSNISLETPSGPPIDFNSANFMQQGTAVTGTSHSGPGPQLNNQGFMQQGTAVPITSHLNDGNIKQIGAAAPVSPQIGAAPLLNNGNFMQQGAAAPIMSQIGLSPKEQLNNGSFIQQGPAVPITAQTGQPSQLNSGSTIQQGTAATGMLQIGKAPQVDNGSFMQQGTAALGLSQTGPSTHLNNGSLMQQGIVAPVMSQIGQVSQLGNGNFLSHQGSGGAVAPQPANLAPNVLAAQHNGDNLGNFSLGKNPSLSSQPVLSSSTGALAMVPQPSKEKFETKSAVWADTLSRGLVNLNISGPKTNPLADIGVDFDAINRKEKRMEKPTTTTATSTVTMGKAMGSGSGIGRAGAGALRAPQNPMMGSGMGMGGGMNMGMSMYGAPNPGFSYGGMGQPMGMGRGMGQGNYMQAPAGFPPGSTMSGGYNPMMGGGGYQPQQPYGGGYR